MTIPSKLLSVSRTTTTNITRMFVLIGFTTAIMIVHLFVAPVPDVVLAMFALYIGTVTLYQAILRKSSSAAAVDRQQILAFMADITVLTAIYGGLSAWWMRSTGNYTLAFGVAFLAVVALISAVYVSLTFARIIGRSEKRHRLIIKAAWEWVITTDDAGRITSANEATFQLTGRSSEEVVGLAFEDLLEEESRAVATAEIRATLADGISRTFVSRYRSADGSLHWVRCSSNRFSDEGSVTEVLIVGRDTTDRMRARRREARLAETEQLVHLGSWEWDIKTDVVQWSDELYRIFRMERNGQLAIADFFAKVHPDDAERVRATFQRSVQTGETFDYDHRIAVAPDETRVLHVVARVVVDEAGCPARIIGSSQDITERNILTEQLRQSQKMEAVGRLAGGIAHDFNNVLTVIKTYSGFLIETLGDDSSARADAEEIRKAADKAASLTRQLLVFSRWHLVEPHVIDLNASVSSLEGMLKRLLSEDVKFEVRLETDLWCVRADPDQIEQVLMNLVVNARDAMPDGGMLRIETANSVLGSEYTSMGGAEAGRFAMLSVCDTGCGMTEETQARIFEPFFTTKELGRGTGLGLSIVYGIVKQSGGHITAHSEVGRGTTIKIYLPEVDADATVTDAAAPFAGVRGGSETILLVEDEEAVRRVVSRILQGGGYDVLEASNGVDAAAMWESRMRSIDMVLTDMVMPGMGGRDLANRVRRLSSRTPILFMSGYTEDPIAALGAGANEVFIEKPFTAEALLLRVRALLDGNEHGLAKRPRPGIKRVPIPTN